MEDNSQLNRYLRYMIENKGSDLHLKAGSTPHIRVNGEVYPISEKKLSNEKMEEFAKEILPSEAYNKLHEEKEIDYSFVLDDKIRFRVNLFYQINGLSIAMRAIPYQIPTLKELDLPETLSELIEKKEGLILLTGPTGSGKSTTAASLIDIINKKYRYHIITIEDPIEYVFSEDKSIISQRAIGENSKSFEHALKSAFREDFDVLFIGEIRNRETMEIALHAADTGHLVISTLHTNGTAETINRIINMFPSDGQHQVRNSLSEIIIGIVFQRLVPTKQNSLTPAVEIMKNTARISELIRHDRDDEINSALDQGYNTYGTTTIDQSLARLYKAGIIDAKAMLDNAYSPSDLKLIIDGVIKQ